MGTENENNNKKNAKKKKLIKKLEKKQKNNSNVSIQNNNQNVQVLYCREDYDEKDFEIEEFKRKIQSGSIHAKHIVKIKPHFTPTWLEDI